MHLLMQRYRCFNERADDLLNVTLELGEMTHGKSVINCEKAICIWEWN